MSTPERPSYQQRTAYHVTLLGTVALICSAALIIGDMQTREPIEAARERQLRTYMTQVTPVRAPSQIPLEQRVRISHAGERYTAWQITDQDQVKAVVIQTTGQGYGGDIEIVVGIDPGGEIIAARVTEHQETPGLGDKIEAERSDWIDAFEGRSLASTPEAHWAVKKDGGVFDQLTGATITPRGVINAIHDALRAFNARKGQLLQVGEASHTAKSEHTEDHDG